MERELACAAGQLFTSYAMLVISKVEWYCCFGLTSLPDAQILPAVFLLVPLTGAPKAQPRAVDDHGDRFSASESSGQLHAALPDATSSAANRSHG
jgi:hypothetical protein